MSSSAAVEVTGARSAQMPGALPLLGHLGAFGKDPLGFMCSLAAYGDVVPLKLVQPAVAVTHPDGVRHVLVDNHTNYRKSYYYHRLKRLAGEGLLTSEGTFWLRQRRLAQPAFHRQRLAGLHGTMVRRTEAMLEAWASAPTGERSFDVSAEMMQLTLGIAGDTLFSVDLLKDAPEVGKAAAVALEICNDWGTALFMTPLWFPSPRNLRFRRAYDTLNGVVQRIISQRRADTGAHDDLLTMFMEMKDADTGERMDDVQLRDEVMTMLLAGHETTANALTWTISLLAKHPEVVARVREEARGVLAKGPLEPERLGELSYTAMVLDESMRLLPPAWGMSREAIAEDTIMGVKVPAGSSVMLSPYATQRRADFWPDPERFDPERFRPEAVAQRHRFAFFPFGGGPRLCIGKPFADMEMRTALAMMVARYDFTLDATKPIVPQPTVTLRPASGVWVRRANAA